MTAYVPCQVSDVHRSAPAVGVARKKRSQAEKEGGDVTTFPEKKGSRWTDTPPEPRNVKQRIGLRNVDMVDRKKNV